MPGVAVRSELAFVASAVRDSTFFEGVRATVSETGMARPSAARDVGSGPRCWCLQSPRCVRTASRAGRFTGAVPDASSAATGRVSVDARSGGRAVLRSREDRIDGAESDTGRTAEEAELAAVEPSGRRLARSDRNGERSPAGIRMDSVNADETLTHTELQTTR